VSPPIVVTRGRSAIVLVAPHAGRRDPARRPWGSARLRMNDLHTGALTRELAARLDASALVNDGGDRNDVDWNRIGAVHDAAPHVLDALARLIEDGLARHPRVQVLTVHGWNVVQPAVDIGLGVRPSAATLLGGGESAVSERFAATTLPRLATCLDAAGIVTTPGVRYPARARENLLQLFTTRHQGDAREPVRRLTSLADRVDALQLEMSLPLRLPGTWRERFVDAMAHALASDDGAHATWPLWDDVTAREPESAALEFVAPGLSGLAALDAHGARLLLFTDDGRLFTFTGERAGCHAPDRVAGLRLTPLDSGVLELAYDGPMLAFPDTTPFLDLERGLAGARVTSAVVTLRALPSHDGCAFGRVVGEVRIAGADHPVDGVGIQSRREAGLGARLRAGLRLADGSVIVARGGDGFVCRGGSHTPVERCRVEWVDGGAAVTVTMGDGTTVAVTAPTIHRLPVVPGEPGAGCFLFAACHDHNLAGWIAARPA
jgi:hypothetical protein